MSHVLIHVCIHMGKPAGMKNRFSNKTAQS